MAFDFTGLKTRGPGEYGPGEALIYLTKGLTALVDEIDLPRLEYRSFRASQSRSKIYAKNDKLGYLHQVITGAAAGMVVDHLNGNGLDCRRDNLRVCGFDKNAQNAQYRIGVSGYRGVHISGKRYRARIRFGDVHYHIGYYATALEAADAYDKMALELFGPFAWTNAPRVLAPDIIPAGADIPF